MKLLDEIDCKNKMVELLNYFHKFCVQNHLKYSIAYGTMLGAIRHKGFIPWDDDIDIIMPRDEYVKLINLFKENSFCELKTLEGCENYLFPFAKLTMKNTLIKGHDAFDDEKVGLYLDIFPLDIVKENYSLRENKKAFKLFMKITKLRWFKSNNNFKHALKEKIWNFLYGKSIKSRKKKIKRLVEKTLRKYTKNQGIYTNVVWQVYPNKYLKINTIDFNNLILVDFESLKVNCLGEYDKILKDLYDNYMELPPIEERNKHNHNVYLIE